MESYFLRVKTFSRGKGSSATKAAAYRSGERIRDERSGAVFDYSDRTDVVHAEIILPADRAGDAGMAWALNRSVLWNAVQNSGRNWNSRLAREVLVLLPTQLSATERTDLTRRFGHELADRYASAVDLAVHQPRPNADQRHHHAHLLMTTRQVGPAGLGARTNLDLSGTERHARGLGPSREDLLWIRERWAQVTNEALHAAGVAERIDHRSYKAQGIDREPKLLVPQSIFYAERLSGKATVAGDDIRARHRERIEARAKGGDELERVLERQRKEGREHAVQWTERREVKRGIPQGALTREQLKEKRRAYCKANAVEINRRQRERYRAHAGEAIRQQRQRRMDNLVEYRRREHESYLRRRAAKALALNSLSIQEPQSAQIKAPTVAQPEQKSLPLDRSSPVVSAEESVKNWLAFRDAHVQAPADESLNRWLTYREGQMQTASPEGPSQDRSRERDVLGTGAPEGEEAGKSKSGRKNDMSL